MESNQPSRSNLKRKMISEDSDSDSDSGKPTAEKRVRFPKGKKARLGDEAVNIRRAEDDDEIEIGIGIGLADPRSAAKEREKRRSQRNHDRFGEDGIGEDVSKAEVSYEGLDSENLMEDGILIEPFNLDKEREEGYFDADGNFVEYAPNVKNQVKDAWLDSVEAGETKLYARKTEDEDGDGNGDGEDLPLSDGDDIGKIKRRIADVLEDGETVLQALRRLKGASSSARNKKEKMPAETKRVFDQLTEDAVTLMDKYGEYNVNHEKREIFEREAQGYESLARSRSQGAALGTNNGAESAGDEYDMFGEDDEEATAQASNSDGVGPSQLENDYVFDESSGYYYSSSLGYYYDPSTGLYCSAASGLWYSFNEETGAYDEITHHDQAAAAAADAETGGN